MIHHYPVYHLVKSAVFLCLLTFGSGLVAQATFTGNVLIEDQADLDAFEQSNGQPWEALDGDFTIDPTDTLDDFTNLTQLQSITGTLIIRDYGDDNIRQTIPNPFGQFLSLETVGTLQIGGNDTNDNRDITSIQNGTLTTVTNDFIIQRNRNLAETDFSDLISVGGDFILLRNLDLNLMDFPALTTIDGQFRFDNNDNLSSLEGLENVRFLGTDVFIINNDQLATLTDFTASNGQRSTIDTLQISNNIGLADTDADNSLELNITEALIVIQNDNLETLGGDLRLAISNENDPISQVTIRDNPRLQTLSNVLDRNGTSSITDLGIQNNDALRLVTSSQLDVQNSFVFANNASAQRLPNLRGSDTLTGDLVIINNASLAQTTRLDNIVFIGGDLTFQNNDAITTTSALNPAGGSGLDGFSALTSAASMVFDDNDGIQNLDDFTSLVNLDNFLFITNNDNLGDCCQLPCQVTVNGQQFDTTNPAVTVSDNTGSCEDKQAIRDNCTSAGCFPAPVELTTFTGAYNEEGSFVTLDWNTASEQENDYFAVQRSTDGSSFVTIGTVEGNGNSDVAIDYYFDDYEPAAGINYYRLQQFDYDGTNEYSDVIAVSTGDVSARGSVTIFPNPATTDQVNVTLDASWESSRTFVEVYNANGQLVFSQNVSGGNIIPVDASDLRPGFYALRVTDGNRNVTERLVIR